MSCSRSGGARVIEAARAPGGARFRVPEGFERFEEGDIIQFVDQEIELADGDCIRLDPLEWWRIERVSSSSLRLAERCGFWRSLWQEVNATPWR